MPKAAWLYSLKEKYLNCKKNLEEEIERIAVVDLNNYLERTKINKEMASIEMLKI